MTVQNVPNPIVHRVSLNPENETRKARTRLDEIFEEKEARAAQRFSSAELEKMAIESENEVARLRGEPPKYKYQGGEMDDEEKKKQEAKQAEQRQKLVTQAKALIDSGMEPQQVGQMLMGLTPTGSTQVASQGINFKDVMEMVTFMVGKKEADELKDIIVKLDKRIDDLTKNPSHKEESKPVDPITYARQQAEAVVAWNKAIRELMPEPPSLLEKGEPLEIVKERNRHAEKIEEIKNEREYKHGLVDVAADIPENIGRGLARQIFSEHSKNNGSGGLPYTTCESCGTKIIYSPDAKQIKCPSCGAIYARTGTTEVKTEEG